MTILSALVLIRALSVFHITLAFYFLTAPHLIADQNIVFILSESMHMPPVHGFEKPTTVTAFLALLFGLLGLSDFTAASMTEATSLEYWGSQVPVRLLFFFGVTGYTYLFKDGGLMAQSGTLRYKSGPGDLLKNGMVFSWGFVEIVMWFWIYMNVREERKAFLAKMAAAGARRDE